MAFQTILTLAELPPGERTVIEVENTWLAVFNVDGTVYAIEDICTHDYGPLGEGEVSGIEVECPRHGARFNLQTGKPTMPAVKPVARFAVQLLGDDIQVDLQHILNKS